MENKKRKMGKESKWDAKLYTDKHAFVYQYGAELIELLNPKSHEDILDIGCGTGQLTYEISQHANRVVGMDQSQAMIDRARLDYSDIDFRTADVTKFSFNEEYDAIFSNATLHWVLEPDLAIKRMKDHLKTKGRMILEFGAQGNVETILTQLRKTLMQNGYQAQAQIQSWYFPSQEEYKSKLLKHGFQVEFCKEIDRPTVLADEESGIKDWLSMFGNRFFDGISLSKADAMKSEIQAALQSKCLLDGKWIADYRRIRIVAVKE